MKRGASAVIALILLCSLTLLSGCAEEETSDPAAKRQTRTTRLIPESPGEEVFENELVTLDISRRSEGYFTLCYRGSVENVKIQITVPEGGVYTYSLARHGEAEVFPLTGGAGSYEVKVLENAYDDMYALAFSADFRLEQADEFKPYLYPNQYVWYTPRSEAVAFGIRLSEESRDDLDYVEKVYDYVTGNIVYDTELAANVPLGYIPDIDSTLERGKGICFDYASLMTALLRTQGIPTKLVVGYSGTAYHAWISVYLQEAGWVDKIIRFDGKSWSLMDPTLAASNDREDVKRYIGDGGNYIAKYFY